jgi:hypothetical protein
MRGECAVEGQGQHRTYDYSPDALTGLPQLTQCYFRSIVTLWILPVNLNGTS